MHPQQIAGRYDVVREVGRGGMGSVWLCTDRVLGREVALKRVGGLPGESTPHAARALREARSSAALNHPHVVALFDAVEDEGQLWLVMEYLPSRTLSKVVEEDGALPPERAARIGAQAADGLAAAHARGTVHRDVKPGNILVTQDDHAKISDFGIARTLGDDQLTQTGMVAGTPLYFSPELARGAATSPAADVWALGASLYAAVEGEAPWPQQENAIAMLVHIAGHEPPLARHAGPLTDVIAQMMTPDPARRISMEQARERLRSVASGEPLSPGTAGAIGPAGVAATQVLPVPAPSVGPELAPEPVPELAAEPAAEPVAAAPVAAASQSDQGGRRGRAVLLAAVAVLALAVGIGLVVVLGGEDEPAPVAGRTDAASPSARPTSSAPDDGGSTTSEETEEAEPSEAPEPTETEPTETEPPSTDGDPAAYVESYYAQLPGDPGGAWEMLDPGYQAEVGSYDDYVGFWNTISAVTVEQAVASDDGVVDVTLTYQTGGSTQSETRQITVGETEDGQRIVADTVT